MGVADGWRRRERSDGRQPLRRGVSAPDDGGKKFFLREAYCFALRIFLLFKSVFQFCIL
jgi:hypothetical protein